MKNTDIVILSYKNSFIGLLNFTLLIAISLIFNEIYLVFNQGNTISGNPTGNNFVSIFLFGVLILTPLFFAFFGTIALIVGLMLRDLKEK